jgi:hypothetical protein
MIIDSLSSLTISRSASSLELSKGFKKAVDVSKLIAPSAIVDAIVCLIEDEAAAGQVLRVLPDAGAVLQPYPAWHQMPTLPPLPGGAHAHAPAAASAASGGNTKKTGGHGKGDGRPQAKL